jgi:hypothetical protein
VTAHQCVPDALCRSVVVEDAISSTADNQGAGAGGDSGSTVLLLVGVGVGVAFLLVVAAVLVTVRRRRQAKMHLTAPTHGTSGPPKPHRVPSRSTMCRTSQSRVPSSSPHAKIPTRPPGASFDALYQPEAATQQYDTVSSVPVPSAYDAPTSAIRPSVQYSSLAAAPQTVYQQTSDSFYS